MSPRCLDKRVFQKNKTFTSSKRFCWISISRSLIKSLIASTITYEAFQHVWTCLFISMCLVWILASVIQYFKITVCRSQRPDFYLFRWRWPRLLKSKVHFHADYTKWIILILIRGGWILDKQETKTQRNIKEGKLKKTNIQQNNNNNKKDQAK